MRRLIAIVGLCLAVGAYVATCRQDAKSVATTPTVGLNVRDYGAIADDGLDDTAALQAAAADLVLKTVRILPTGGSGEATFPQVTFPAGTYNVSGSINWGPYASLVADGSVVIQATAGTEPFWFEGGYMVRLAGFTFMGGSKAITYRNANANGGRLQLDFCRFQSTTGPAIWAGPQGGIYFSNQVTLRNCKWFACAQALVSWADITTLAESWVQWTDSVAASNTSCLEIRGGRINLENSMFVPVFPIANYGCTWLGFWGITERNSGAGVYCRGAEFHGEYGGLPIVYMAGVPDLHYPFQGASIVFRDTQLSCGQTSRADTACIQLASGMPQTVTVDASSNILGPCPLIQDRNGDGASVLASLENGANRIRFLVGANVFYPLSPPVPTYLAPFVRNLAL